MPAIITVLRPGAPKTHPYTICVIANPALQTTPTSGVFIADPILGDKPGFDASATYVVEALFGLLPGHAEAWLADPRIGPDIRVVSIWHPQLPAIAANALVNQDDVSNLLVPRREVIVPFLAAHGLAADVTYAISGSPTHLRASAWFTTDDDQRGGVPFMLDGVAKTHRHFNRIPGTIAMHRTSRSLVALHEFQHAASSFTNGMVVDLYLDDAPAVNRKRGRPIPSAFATYDAIVHQSSPTRGGAAYPPTWQSFHCQSHNPALPSVMDNFGASPTPEACQNDTITRRFLTDRLLAKLSR
jgi:hypothetical protein